ncbi:unnamed protein product [Haemonchus placei]|uniref:Uncharacterized protein n=1 Tax=Haemonchus placei TaxID=6290 RepID=A0A3P7VXD8_HAEPC|nr:unnamed protein product [Haemonchus placei]
MPTHSPLSTFDCLSISTVTTTTGPDPTNGSVGHWQRANSRSELQPFLTRFM